MLYRRISGHFPKTRRKYLGLTNNPNLAVIMSLLSDLTLAAEITVNSSNKKTTGHLLHELLPTDDTLFYIIAEIIQ